MKITLNKINGCLVPYSQEDKDKIDNFKDGAVYEIDIKNSDIRTIKQNASIHLYCKLIAEHLNKQGFVIQDVIKLNTKWDMVKVKEMLFKPVVMSLYTKDSTTKLNRNEFELIIDTLVLALGKKGIDYIPEFPSRELWDIK